MDANGSGPRLVLPAVLAVALIVSTAAFAVFAFPNGLTPTSSSNGRTDTTTSQPSPSSCAVAYSPSLIQGIESNTSAVVFLADSTADICVAVFAVGSNMTWTGPPTYSMLENDEFVHPVNLSVTYTPNPIAVTDGGVGMYVFQITPTGGTRAIYAIGLPFDCWGARVLLGVGYSIAQLQAMHLKAPVDVVSCPAFYGSSRVIGISNLTPTYTG